VGGRNAPYGLQNRQLESGSYTIIIKYKGKDMSNTKWERYAGVKAVEDLRRFIFPGFRVEVAGSLRRECKTIHDIDLVIMGNSRDIAACLQDVHINQIGDRRIRFEYLSIPIDVCCVSFEWEWDPMLLHHTGSCEFNIFMRAIAKAKGYKLNEYGLEVNKNCGITAEEHIFSALGVKYIRPILRSVQNSFAWERIS